MKTLSRTARAACFTVVLAFPGFRPAAAEDQPERKLVTRVEPEYPAILRQKAIGGTVRLRVTVRPDGAVKQVEIIGGNSILAEAAARAVKQWRYAQAEKEAVIQVSVHFDPAK